MSTVPSQRQPTKPASGASLTQAERRDRRQVMAKWVADEINRGRTPVVAKERAATFFGVSTQQIRKACREFLNVSASVKPTKKKK